MTSKERFARAIAHKQPDGVPVDFGSTAVTGMHVTCVAALRDYYGLEMRPVKVCEPYQMLGMIENDLADVLGVDTTGIMPRNTLFGFPIGNWKEWKSPWGQNLLVPRDFNVIQKGNDIYIFPEGDTGGEPSGRMPGGGYFFDTIVRQPPINEEHLDYRDNLEEFGPISDAELAHFKRSIEQAGSTNRGVVANFGGMGFGDIAMVPAPFLKHPKGIRDIAEWYISTVIRREYVRAIFEKQLEYSLENLPKIHAAVGNAVDVVFICGTDFGTQTGTFCSVQTFDELWMPFYKPINDWIHANTTWKTFKHSCGAIEPFLERFIQAGFDIINPVQCSAAGMEPEKLKDRYGDRIVFWGGGANTQKTLPFGTPQQVREEVLMRCEIFAAGGGFVFNAIHNVQAGIPVQNIVAMVNAVKEFNGS